MFIFIKNASVPHKAISDDQQQYFPKLVELREENK